ncbi:MAG: T9SS type A sorting domain-containing protein [Flavobacteriales bacterium]
MRKLFFLFFIITSNYFLLAQNFFFEQIGQDGLTTHTIDDLYFIGNHNIKHSDIDQDGDIDLMVSGHHDQEVFLQLYKNHGDGTFSRLESSIFPKLRLADIHFLDIDNDGDDDLFIGGTSDSLGRVCKLYLNNSRGVFKEVENTPFHNLNYRSSFFGDVNNDNYPDIIIQSLHNSIKQYELFLNDGNGNFTLGEDLPFKNESLNSINLLDIDNDDDLDIFTTSINTHTLYLNDGQGTLSGTIQYFSGDYKFGRYYFSDFDGDDDLDIIVKSSNSLVYINDGNGNFPTSKTMFKNQKFTSFEIIEYDKDGNLIILTTKSKIKQICRYDKLGNLLDSIDVPFSNYSISFSTFLDIDGDQDKDIIISGKSEFEDVNSTKTFTNEGNYNYKITLNSPITNFGSSSIDFGDIDGDGDEDMVISGTYKDPNTKQIYKPDIKLLINHNGIFTEKLNSAIKDSLHAVVKFIDVDGDDDLDIFIAGGEEIKNFSLFPETKIFKNDGHGNFTEFKDNNIIKLKSSTIQVADFNGDQYMDILLTGIPYPYTDKHGQYLYINNGYGNGTFKRRLQSPYILMKKQTIAYADIDGDNDLDIMLTGLYKNEGICKIFINSGKGDFREETDVPFVGTYESAIEFGDIDNDGDQDVIISGSKTIDGYHPFAQVGINDGIGNFECISQSTVANYKYPIIKLLDLDSDGDLDLFISGTTFVLNRHNTFYENDGNGNFHELHRLFIPEHINTSVRFADFDNDDDQDLIISGWYNNYQPQTRLFQNNTCSSINASVNELDSLLSTQFKNGSSYQWIDCNNDTLIPLESNDKFYPQESGDYAVIIRKNNCIDTSSCISFNKYAELEPVDGFIFSYHPNPTHGTVNIEFTELLNNVELTVTNTQGQQISYKKLSKAYNTKIELGNSNGIYFLTISSNKGSKTIKLIKQ